MRPRPEAACSRAAATAASMSATSAIPVDIKSGRPVCAACRISGICVKRPDEILWPAGSSRSTQSNVRKSPAAVNASNPWRRARLNMAAVSSGDSREALKVA